MIGVSPTYLSKVERDEFPPPAEDKVSRLDHWLEIFSFLCAALSLGSHGHHPFDALSIRARVARHSLRWKQLLRMSHRSLLERMLDLLEPADALQQFKQVEAVLAAQLR